MSNFEGIGITVRLVTLYLKYMGDNFNEFDLFSALEVIIHRFIKVQYPKKSRVVLVTLNKNIAGVMEVVISCDNL